MSGRKDLCHFERVSISISTLLPALFGDNRTPLTTCWLFEPEKTGSNHEPNFSHCLFHTVSLLPPLSSSLPSPDISDVPPVAVTSALLLMSLWQRVERLVTIPADKLEVNEMQSSFEVTELQHFEVTLQGGL